MTATHPDKLTTLVLNRWSDLSDAEREPIARFLLPNLDAATRDDMLSEAAGIWADADSIRDGEGSWRDLMVTYLDWLTPEDRHSLCDETASINAAEDTARSVALGVLTRAVAANASALVGAA